MFSKFKDSNSRRKRVLWKEEEHEPWGRGGPGRACGRRSPARLPEAAAGLTRHQGRPGPWVPADLLARRSVRRPAQGPPRPGRTPRPLAWRGPVLLQLGLRPNDQTSGNVLT